WRPWGSAPCSSSGDWACTGTGPPRRSTTATAGFSRGGSCWVLSDEVPTILRDNGYHEVTTPAVGDLVCCRADDGEIVHTAVVYALGPDGEVVVESKWGESSRLVAPVAVMPCAGKITFHHSGRAGHALCEVLDRGPTASP